MLQVFTGDVKPVWASCRRAENVLTKPRARKPLAKAPRHRTKCSMLSRVAHRERAHEPARAEAVGEGTEAPHEVQYVKSFGEPRTYP